MKSIEKQLEEMFEMEYAHLLSYAIRYVKGYHDAEELVQQAFLIALENPLKFLSSKNPGGWLCQVLKSEILHTMRRYAYEAKLMSKLQDCCTEMYNQENNLFLLSETNISCSDDFSLLIERYYHQDTLEEIAIRRGISVPACKMRICRAKKRLKENLDEIANN